MPENATEESPSNERSFLGVVITLSALLMIGAFSAITALNKPDVNPNTSPADPPSLPISPDRPRHLADFSLINWTGSKIDRSQLRGKFLIVDFLFTSCSVTCPVINAHLTEIQQRLTNQSDVVLLSITVDPRDDTPPVLAQYARRFKADPSRWFLLTGDSDKVYSLIKQSFLDQDLDNSFGYMPGNFSHTDRVAIVDPHGDVRAYFDGLNDNTPQAVLDEIAALRKLL